MIMRFACVGVVSVAVASLVLAPGPVLAQQVAPEVAALAAGPAGIQWHVLVPNEGVTLRVGGPFGEVEEFEFGPRETPGFELTDRHGQPRPDGVYTWELRVRPVLAPSVRRELEQSRETGDETVMPRLRRQGLLPRHPLVSSGSFSILGGSFVAEGVLEGDQDGGLSAVATPTGDLSVHAATTVIGGDLSVWNSLCVGVDCTDAESFGFDTIRLKENNTRIKFEDTSTSAGFPTNDWQLTANDSASGGMSKFSIEDIDHSRVPFTIEANARSNALYVNSSGRVGLGTSVPVVEQHIQDSDTPTVRLHQDSSFGWPTQVWDLAANETSFFIRDVTNGSTLPFRIGPNTPTNTLTLRAGGKVGIGTWSPTSPVHAIVTGTTDPVLMLEGTNQSDSLSLKVQHPNAVVGFGVAGNTGAFFSTAARHDAVVFGQSGRNLLLGIGGSERVRITGTGKVGISMTTPTHLLDVGASGAYCDGGAWVDGSSRRYKQDIEELSGEAAAEAFAQLSPVRFEYTAMPGEQHLGFIAEDVPELVATGDRTGLSPMDIVAVLTKVLQDQQKLIADQRQALAELQARMAQLEAK